MKKAGVFTNTIIRVRGNQKEVVPDLVVVEEPLELRLIYRSNNQTVEKTITVTMRTPGDDFDLCIGFLLSEHIIDSSNAIKSINYCKDSELLERGSIVKVVLHDFVTPNLSAITRNFAANSSCGVCGKLSIDALVDELHIQSDSMMKVAAKVILGISKTVYKKQALFNHTGGIHAAALITSDGIPLTVKEDIGRHNAVDKVIGAVDQLDATFFKSSFLFVSSRIGYEIIQKTARANIPMLVAVGAPSDMAIAIAQKTNITLIGFQKETGFNIYHGGERIIYDMDYQTIASN